MQTKLQQYFPMLRSREEILREIDATVKLTEKFTAGGRRRDRNFWISVQECVESRCCMIRFLRRL
mgnify:CR=1 FL=1